VVTVTGPLQVGAFEPEVSRVAPAGQAAAMGWPLAHSQAFEQAASWVTTQRA